MIHYPIPRRPISPLFYTLEPPMPNNPPPREPINPPPLPWDTFTQLALELRNSNPALQNHTLLQLNPCDILAAKEILFKQHPITNQKGERKNYISIDELSIRLDLAFNAKAAEFAKHFNWQQTDTNQLPFSSIDMLSGEMATRPLKKSETTLPQEQPILYRFLHSLSISDPSPFLTKNHLDNTFPKENTIKYSRYLNFPEHAFLLNDPNWTNDLIKIIESCIKELFPGNVVTILPSVYNNSSKHPYIAFQCQIGHHTSPEATPIHLSIILKSTPKNHDPIYWTKPTLGSGSYTETPPLKWNLTLPSDKDLLDILLGGFRVDPTDHPSTWALYVKKLSDGKTIHDPSPEPLYALSQRSWTNILPNKDNPALKRWTRVIQERSDSWESIYGQMLQGILLIKDSCNLPDKLLRHILITLDSPVNISCEKRLGKKPAWILQLRSLMLRDEIPLDVLKNALGLITWIATAKGTPDCSMTTIHYNNKPAGRMPGVLLEIDPIQSLNSLFHHQNSIPHNAWNNLYSIACHFLTTDNTTPRPIFFPDIAETTKNTLHELAVSNFGPHSQFYLLLASNLHQFI